MKPCLTCGQPATGSRCAQHQAELDQAKHRDADRRRPTSTGRGYDSRWQRLSARARRLQPWCIDCGTRADLTSDHKAWPAARLTDVEVVCRKCNSKRGPIRDLST